MQMVIVIMAIMAHHGNIPKTGVRTSSAARFSSYEGKKYGVGLLFMTFWHGLRGIIGLQCSTALQKRCKMHRRLQGI
jgi:hypothetical protein